ncbi:polyketide synthase [Streptomyces albulus]|nr:polyketide synthase [Streptomyces noursei]
MTEGRSAIGQVPPERWGARPGDFAALLPDVTSFDAAFFGIPPEEAAAMDPQALVLLEESVALLAHAGYTREEVKGSRTGVYVGARGRLRAEDETRHSIRAVGQNYLAANVSQFLDLRGPSLVVDTACSSALTAMNMAVQALRDGEVESAVVGAVSLLTTGEAHDGMRHRGILSPEPAFHVSTAAPPARSWATAAAWCCSSRWTGRWPTATGCTPSSRASR